MRYKRLSTYFPFFYLVFICTFFLKTLAPDTIPEDSGELAVAGFSLGIPHPPGYPLYVILLKLFLFLPFKTVIFRANLFSALMAGCAVLILYKLILNINKDQLTALLLSLLFAFSKTFWSQSVITEIYTFNILLVIIYLYYTWNSLSDKKYIGILAFLSGILMVSHYSNLLIILPVITALFFRYKKEIFKLNYVLWGLFPLSLFFVLYIRSLADPMIDWGNPENPHKFIVHILRLSFGSMVSKHPRSFQLILEQSKMFFRIFIYQFGYLISAGLLFFFISGFKKLIRPDNASAVSMRSKKILFLSLLFFLSLGIILILNFKTDEESFFINHLFFIPFILTFIIILSFNKFKGIKIFLLGLAVCLLFFKNFVFNNRARDNYTLLYNRDVLKSTTYHATLFSAKDFSTFPLLYYQKIEYLRPDLIIYDWFGNVFKDIFKNEDFHLVPEYKRDPFREKITDKIRKNTAGEVYYSFQRATLKEIKSLGIIYTYNKDHPVDLHYIDFPLISTNNISYQNYFIRNMISVYYFHLAFFYKQQGRENISRSLFNLSGKFGGSEAKQFINLAVNAMKENDLATAVEYFQKAIENDDSIDKAYFYLGNIYFQQKRYSLAEEMYIKTIQRNKLNALAYNNLGNLYLETGNTSKAKEIFKAGLFTGYGKLFNNIGVLFLKENNLKDAGSYFSQGIQNAPDFIPLYLNISVVLSKLNQWEQAKEFLRKAYQLNKEDENVILNSALVHIKLGQLKEAESFLKEGRRKFPDSDKFNYYLKIIRNHDKVNP
ncbi:MAG: tetratricopeptide repeat protein [Spirochaetes bacterium]|nr:tetratricopeptide repeat protein [Spirochaetota bacterium]